MTCSGQKRVIILCILLSAWESKHVPELFVCMILMFRLISIDWCSDRVRVVRTRPAKSQFPIQSQFCGNWRIICPEYNQPLKFYHFLTYNTTRINVRNKRRWWAQCFPCSWPTELWNLKCRHNRDLADLTVPYFYTAMNATTSPNTVQANIHEHFFSQWPWQKSNIENKSHSSFLNSKTTISTLSMQFFLWTIFIIIGLILSVAEASFAHPHPRW